MANDSIYNIMRTTPQLDTNAGSSALNASTNAFQSMSNIFNTMRQSIIDEEQKNLERKMQEQHHKDQMDYQNRSLAQADKHHTEDTEFNRWKTEGDWRQKELDRANQLQIAGMRSGGGGGGGRSGGGGKGRKSGTVSPTDIFLSNAKAVFDELNEAGKSGSASSSNKVQASSQSASKSSAPVQKPSVSVNENKGNSADVNASAASSTGTDAAKPLFSKDTFAKRAAALMGEPEVKSGPLADTSFINVSKPSIDVPVPFDTSSPALRNERLDARIASDMEDLASPQKRKLPDFSQVPSEASVPRMNPFTGAAVYTPVDEEQLRKDRAHFLEDNGLLESNKTYRIDGRDVNSGSAAGIDYQLNRFYQLPRQEQLEQLSRSASSGDVYQDFLKAATLEGNLRRLAFPSKEPLQSNSNPTSSDSVRQYGPSDVAPQDSPFSLPFKESQLKQAGEPTEKDLQNVTDNAKKMADTLYEVETKGGSAMSVRSGIPSINFDPTVMPSDADIYNANSSKFVNATPEIVKQWMFTSQPVLQFMKDLDTLLIKRDTHGNIDHKTTNLNIAEYAGRQASQMSRQERYEIMKACYYLANTRTFKHSRMGAYYKAIGETLQDSFDINVDANDDRYSDILTGKAYKFLGGADSNIYKNKREAEKSLNDERLAVETRQGLKAPGTVTSKDLESLTGLSKLDQITKTDVKGILNDPFSNPVVSRYLYLKGRYGNRDLKIAATAYVHAMMGIWNREAEDRAFKRPDQVRRFFYDAADKGSSTYKDFEDAFLRSVKILEKGGSL